MHRATKHKSCPSRRCFPLRCIVTQESDSSTRSSCNCDTVRPLNCEVYVQCRNTSLHLATRQSAPQVTLSIRERFIPEYTLSDCVNLPFTLARIHHYGWCTWCNGNIPTPSVEQYSTNGGWLSLKAMMTLPATAAVHHFLTRAWIDRNSLDMRGQILASYNSLHVCSNGVSLGMF